MRLLDKINSPEDLKKLSIEELDELAQEIREYMIDVLSQVGGHVAPNLGSVELTLALHYVFESPRDKLIWDVGHQAYPHKIITGRREAFKTVRQWGGISGFLKRSESPHDIFGAGHASTSLSAALGFAVARDLKGDKFKVVAIIGDGALTGGMALEALNQIGSQKRDMIIVVNDNEMSIAENVGAISNYLSKLVTSPYYFKLKEELWELLDRIPSRFLSKRAKEIAKKVKETLKNFAIPTILFEELGYEYIGPLNGHDTKLLIETFERARKLRGPILIHILTKKGKGYKPAEEKTELFHGLGPFDKKTGEPIKKPGPPRYTKIFGKTIVELAEKDERIVAVTAAMPLGTGLDLFRERFPERFFDVGIAEQHAVTFSAGMALGGLKPFAAIYSTFLQRAFDQLIHDVALQKIPVRFALDRGGLVGEDGPTHHGVFDLAYLRMIPNFVVMAPKDENELRDMIYTAWLYDEGPVAFRYPRARTYGFPLKAKMERIPIGKWEILKKGKDFEVVILATGAMVWPSFHAAERLEKEFKVKPTVINARFIKPLDRDLLLEILENKPKIIFTVEENNIPGGFGTAILEFIEQSRMFYKKLNIVRLGIPDKFIEHGPREKLLEIVGLDEEGLYKSFSKSLKLL